MPSTLGATTAYAATLLTLLAVVSNTYAHTHDHSTLAQHTKLANLHNRALSAMTYEGCFSSSSGLTDQGSYEYQTSGYCQGVCVNATQAVLGLSAGSNCWCGDVLPPASDKVSDSNCNTPCNGYGNDNCTCIGVDVSNERKD